MKVNAANLSGFRNTEHLQFHTDVNILIENTDPEILEIKPEYDKYAASFAIEGSAVKKATHSPLTDRIKEADTARDDVWRGLVAAVDSAKHHYKAGFREAGERLQAVFTAWGKKLSDKPMSEEIAAINTILRLLEEKHHDDVELLGLAGWCEELQNRNDVVSQLMHERYGETAAATNMLKMRKVRRQVDLDYRDMIDLINSLMRVRGTEIYTNLILLLNAIIDRANTMVAIRRGRSGSSSSEE